MRCPIVCDINPQTGKHYYMCAAHLEANRAPLPFAVVIDGEQWRTCPGFAAYEVSDRGRIRRMAGGATGAQPGRILSQKPDPVGYPAVALSLGHGKIVYRRVHPKVAEAFLGPRPTGLVINHKNGNKMDARAVNLEYVTKSQDIFHALDTGLNRQRGVGHWAARLTDSQARSIWAARGGPESSTTLGLRYGVSAATVRAIWLKVNWRCIHAEDK